MQRRLAGKSIYSDAAASQLSYDEWKWAEDGFGVGGRLPAQSRPHRHQDAISQCVLAVDVESDRDENGQWNGRALGFAGAVVLGRGSAGRQSHQPTTLGNREGQGPETDEVE